MSTRVRPRSITGKLLAGILAVFLLAMALQYVSYYESYESRKALAHESAEATARSAAFAADSWLASVMSDLQAVWTTTDTWSDGNPLPSSVLQVLMAMHPDWLGAGVIDSSTGQSFHAPKDIAQLVRDQIRMPDASIKPCVSRTITAGGKTVFVVTVPVAGPKGHSSVAYAAVDGKSVGTVISKAVGASVSTCLTDGSSSVVCSTGTAARQASGFARSAPASTVPPATPFTAQASSTLSDWRVTVFTPGSAETAGGRWLVRSIFLSFLASLLAVFMGRRITSPIRKLSRAAAAVAVGDFRRRVHITTGDEIQSLAESFNQMAENLEVHERQLETKTLVQRTLFDLASGITSSLDLGSVTESISSAMKKHFAASQVALFSLNRSTRQLEPVAPDDTASPAYGMLLAVAEQAVTSPGAISMPASAVQADAQGNLGTFVALPLVVGSEKVGVLAAALLPDEPWDIELKSRLELLEMFATWAAVAVHNAKVHGHTVEFHQMLASLQTVVDSLSSSLDLKQVLRQLVLTTCSVTHSKACAIFLADRTGKLTIAESAHLSKRVADKLNVMPGEPLTGQAFASKDAAQSADICQELNSRLRADVEKEGLHGFVSVPILAANEAIGTLNVWKSEPHYASDVEVGLLVSIAKHAGAVIANARLFGKEYQIAETLQTTLKGEVPEQIGKLRFGHKYIPGLDEASVGGDLYDVVELPDNKVAVVVADVVGKGIQAAVQTAMVRYMTRAYLLQWPDSPATTLQLLNRAAVSFAGNKALVTVFCAVIDAETGSMVYANAGHPPAILITRAGRQQILLYRTGMPIGSDDECEYEDRRIVLEQGDKLLLYTDGIIEAKKNGVVMAVEGLENILFACSDLAPADMVEKVCDETSAYANMEIKDDIALVAAGFDEQVAV